MWTGLIEAQRGDLTASLQRRAPVQISVREIQKNKGIRLHPPQLQIAAPSRAVVVREDRGGGACRRHHEFVGGRRPYEEGDAATDVAYAR